MKRSLVLVSSLLAGTILSAEANPFKDMEGLDKFLSDFKNYKSIPSPRTFQVTPSRTAAGVLHYALDKDKTSVILLGLRDDEETYCNFGGKSDEEEEKGQKKIKEDHSATLAQTASREVEEESNGYYAHHPYDLERCPFTDVLMDKNKKSLLYRMYWKKVQKVEGDLLFKALAKAKQEHNKEYKEFIWVPVKNILESLEKEESTIQLEDGKTIELFKPLFQTLSTESGLAFLRSIVTKGNLSRFTQDLHPFQNRLYVLRDREEELSETKSSSSEEETVDLNSNTNKLQHANFKMHWPLPEVSQMTRETYTERLGSGKTIIAYKVPVIPFGKNAWGQERQTLEISSLNHAFKIPLSAEKDQKDFAYAVAAHGAAMVDLKHKAAAIRKKAGIQETKEEPFRGEITNNNSESWNSQSDLSLSRIHLRLVLGKDFKTAEDFKNTLNPQRTADIANLRTYLTLHSEVEETQKHVRPEFKRKINFTESDLDVFADILEWEEQHKKHPVFYHGANADINNLWHSFTHLRELLSLSPLLGQKIAMRGTDIYFRAVQTMADILKSNGYGDYEAGRAALVLCANYVLTAGLKTTRTSSSSIEYFLNNHSVEAPDVEEKFDEATALAGIIAKYSYFRSPFLQFLAHRHPTFENSVLVGISVPSSLIPDHTYAAHGGGTAFTKVDSQGTEAHPTVLDVFKGIQGEYEAHKETPEAFTERTEEKRDLIPEARLSLHPAFALAQDVHMKAFNRFPLSHTEQKQFESEMRAATIGTLADWLRSHFKIMPDSFDSYPTLKYLYHFAYKAMTGEEVKETFAAESFFHLVTNGHVKAVKEFIKIFPDIVNHKNFEPLSIAYQMIRANSSEMLKCICEDISKKTPASFFKTPEAFYKAIRICFYHGAADCLDYLFSDYDLKTIPEALVQVWSRLITKQNVEVNPSSFFPLKATFLKYFPQHGSTLIKSVFEMPISEAELEVLSARGINPRVLLEAFIDANQNQIYPQGPDEILKFMAKNKVDLREHPQLGAKLLKNFFKSYVSQQHLETFIACGISPHVLVEAFIEGTHPQLPDEILNLMAKHKVDLKDHPQLERKLLKFVFKSGFSQQHLETLINCGTSPQALVDAYIEESQNKPSPQDSYEILNLLVKYKMDLSRLHPHTKRPFIFELIRLQSTLLPPEFDPYFYAQLPSLVGCTDLEGKTIFDHAQSAFQKKEKNHILNLISPYKLWVRLPWNSSTQWPSALVSAFLRKDHEKVSQLMQEAPAYIEEQWSNHSVVLYCEKEFPEDVKKLRQKIEESKKRVDLARKALKEKDFHAFYLLFKSFPETIKKASPWMKLSPLIKIYFSICQYMSFKIQMILRKQIKTQN